MDFANFPQRKSQFRLKNDIIHNAKLLPYSGHRITDQSGQIIPLGFPSNRINGAAGGSDPRLFQYKGRTYLDSNPATIDDKIDVI